MTSRHFRARAGGRLPSAPYTAALSDRSQQRLQQRRRQKQPEQPQQLLLYLEIIQGQLLLQPLLQRRARVKAKS
eukprot:COSAG06_NODE_3962_length_4717_cov_3.863794_3_plen_74_part_00